MKVVVTGATGFIGRETIDPLRRAGAEIHCLGRSADAIDDVHWHNVDLLEADAAETLNSIGASHLLHLAWYATPGRFWEAPENVDWVAASLRLVRGFATAGGKRVVIAGSCAEYEWGDDILDEVSTPLRPSTLYGQCKASLHSILRHASEPLGVSMAWARIFAPYGPEESSERLLGSLIASIRTKTCPRFSAGTQERDFVHVQDVASSLTAILLSDFQGPVNVASGESVSVRTFVEHAISLVPDCIPAEFGTIDMRLGDPSRLVGSVTRLKKEIGFEPQFSWRTGLAAAMRAAVHDPTSPNAHV